MDQQPAKSIRGEAAFRGHLTVYLVTGLFLLTLNLLTSPGDLWFYWPLFFWGWCLVFQAVATYGADAPVRAMAVLRSIIPAIPTTFSLPERAPKPAANGMPFAAAEFAAVHERIEGLKAITRQIPDDGVREQAGRLCASAERVAGVMAADRADARMVGWFESALLAPTESLLAGYVRLAGRGITGAEETLRRVEEQNLPRLQARFDDLYDQLHRGEIVDLAVASEMLDLEPPEPPPALTTARP